MKKLIIGIICLLAGLLVGRYAGHTRPLVQAEREFCKTVNMSPEEIRVFMDTSRRVVQSAEEDADSAALVSLNTLLQLEAGNTEAAKDRALRRVSRYYRDYGPPDITNTNQSGRQRLLEKIKRAAEHSEKLREAITTTAEPNL
jgi:hypothetical protein